MIDNAKLYSQRSMNSIAARTLSMAVTYPSDLTVISTWAHVAEAWHNCLTNVLHVKVAVGETDRVITFDLDGRNNSPVSVRSWVAYEIVRTATELRDVEAVRRRLTA